MSLSSFCVVTNALRLNLFKIHDAGKDKKINNSCTLSNECSDINNYINKKENNTMVKVTIHVTGMMCSHCEAHVNKAVQEAFGVQDVVSSHDAGTTIFNASEKLDEDKVRKVIKDAGYEVTGITQE